MPTYVRWREEGASYFFTVVAYRRQRILTKPLSRNLLRTAITTVCRRLPFEIPAIVLLPDHLHCIWTLPADNDDFPNGGDRSKGDSHMTTWLRVPATGR